jgi:hypothetical protein
MTQGLCLFSASGLLSVTRLQFKAWASLPILLSGSIQLRFHQINNASCTANEVSMPNAAILNHEQGIALGF